MQKLICWITQKNSKQTPKPTHQPNNLQHIQTLKSYVEYHKTKDIFHAMRLPGHRNIKNTLIYTQLIEFKDDEFICKVAKTVQEASELIENGFECVCAFDDAKLFKKRK
jgi:hypothetical protein